MRVKIIPFSLSLLLLLWSIIFSDMRVIQNETHGITSLKNGTDIEMVSEYVTITISEELKTIERPNKTFKHTYIIYKTEVEFEMFNTGDEQTVDMYFPIETDYEVEGKEELKEFVKDLGFKTTVDDEEIETNIYVGLYEHNIMDFYDYIREKYQILDKPHQEILGPTGEVMYIWSNETVSETDDKFDDLIVMMRVDFKKGQMRKIVVDYTELERKLGSGWSSRYKYIFTTGATWKDDIGYGRITLKKGDGLTQEVFEGIEFDNWALGNPEVFDDYVVWEFHDLEPPYYFNENFAKGGYLSLKVNY
jgi:hypothetical protein